MTVMSIIENIREVKVVTFSLVNTRTYRTNFSVKL